MSTRQVQAIAVRILLLGVVVAVFGIVMLANSSGGDPTDIDCGGQKMTPGTECGNFVDGWVAYEDAVQGRRESLASSQRNAPVVAVIGVVIALGAGLVLASTAGNGRREPSTRPERAGDTTASTPWWSEGDRS
jgi:drug/metabolite transporter (DMT)-like permease